MSINLLSNVDFGLSQLINALAQNVASDPGTVTNGRIIYNTTTPAFKVGVGGAWVAFLPSTTTLNAIAAAVADVDINNHKILNLTTPTSGSDAANKTYVDGRRLDQAAAPIADVDLNNHKILNLTTPTTGSDAANKTYVDGRRLDQAVAPTASVDLNSQKIINLATPTGAGDAAPKGYVDGLIQGISWKQNVKAASTANLTLSGTQTVDGIALIAGDRVLVKDQTTGGQNGIYLVAAGAWTRALDADTAAEVQSAAVLVDQGTVNGNSSWVQTADGVTLGTTALVFVQFGSGAAQTAGSGLTLSGGAFSVNVDNSSIEINTNILRVKAAGIVNAMIASGLDAAKLTTGVLALTQGGFGVDLTASSANRTTARAALVESGQTLSRTVPGNITGDGTTTSFAFTHSLGTKDVLVQVYEATTDTEVFVEKVHTSTSVATINFAVAPVNTKVYRVIVVG